MTNQNAITLVRGNDTDFNNANFLTINLDTSILDLTSFTATLTVGSVVKTFTNLSSGQIIVNFTAQETATLPPFINGVLKLVDENNKIATIESLIPFKVISVVNGNAIATEPFTLNFEVEQGGINILNVSVESAVSVEVGETTTLPAGSEATVTNSGTGNHLVLDFGIPQGEQGIQGIPGKDGKDGTNGKDGKDGKDGADGKDATVNGINTLTLTANYGLSLTQSGSTANISGKEITDVVDGISAVIPADATESNQLADKAYVGSQIGNGTITINQGGNLKGTFTTNQSGNTTINLDAGGGGGAVDSVNGKTGVVVLTASDVGALPDSTVIPDAQVQSDWTQADNTKVDYIKNKPTIPTDTSDLTNGAGYISGITSTDVTNALGYTPYSSANPDGYTSNVGTVTSVNNVSPVSGDVTLTIDEVAPTQSSLTENMVLGSDGTNASWDYPIEFIEWSES